MAKKNPLTNVIVALTIIIAIGAIATTTTLLIQVGVIDIGLTETPNIVPPLAEIPVVVDDPEETNPDNDLNEELGLPQGFINSEEDILSAFLDTIGLRVTETFGVDAEVRLVDANLEEVIESSFLTVQPLDPRKVITSPEEISALTFFVNTDFSTQLADNGRNFHRFSGWDVINDFGGLASIPIVIQPTILCSGVPNTGKCAQVIGNKNNLRDGTANGSVFHGLSKVIDISDWTREGDLILTLDYSCNQNFILNTKFFVVVQGDFGKTTDIPCLFNQKYTQVINQEVGNSNTVTIQFGAQARNTDSFRMDIIFNNVKVGGNSVIKRDAIELFQSLTIVQNDQEQRILDLGFIEVGLTGQTVFDNEKVRVNGKLESRIDGKTISEHVVSGSGTTIGNQLPLRIDGQDTFIFKIDDQFFLPETFHKFDLFLNDFIVNVGEGEELRVFEYHTPFLVYSLEFNVLPDEIVAFGVLDRVISVLKSDTTFQTCGRTSGEDPILQPEVLPPVVSIISNGFTIVTTNPEAGKLGARDPFTKEEVPDKEFCGVIPNLPRETDLTFKIGNSFFEVSVPASQQNYFIKCVREGCTSNIGFGSNP